MSSFNEANQAKLSLKMKLHFYSFFHSIAVVSEENGYSVMVFVDKITDQVRKTIPNVHMAVDIQTATAK
jgi:hypothetical protein